MLQNTCSPAADDWNTPNIGVQSTTQGGTYSTSGKDGGDPSTWSSTGSHAGQDELRPGIRDQPCRERALLRVRRVGADLHEPVRRAMRSRSRTPGSNVARRRHATAEARQWRLGLLHLLPGIVRARLQQRVLVHLPVELRADLHQLGDARGRHHSDQHRLDQRPAEQHDPAGRRLLRGGARHHHADRHHAELPRSSAASVYLRSITGQTSNGNLKGYMAPLNVAPDSTCVPPPITTTANSGRIDGLRSDRRSTTRRP